MNQPLTGTQVTLPGQPVRGALRMEIGTSSPGLEAGRPFSVTVTIQNPYDVPVEITSVSTVVPVEFEDLERRQQSYQKRRAMREAREVSARLLNQAAGKKTFSLSNDATDALIEAASHLIPFGRFFNAAYKASQVIIASNVGKDTPTIASSIDLERVKAEIAEISTGGGTDKSAAYAKTLDIFKAQLEAAEQKAFASITLMPGNSVVQMFTLKTTRSLFFPPSTYEIPIQISYKIDEIVNQDAIKYKLNVRAPLGAVITGSMVGSAAGFLLKDIFQERAIVAILSRTAPPAALVVWLVALFGNMVLATIAVVSFARKRDTQPFISVEDFWGGLFIGAVTGYTGKSLIDGLITVPHKQ